MLNETKDASPLEEIVVATACYSRENAPRLGVLFNAIGAYSAAAKEKTERGFLRYFDRLKREGVISASSHIVKSRTFGPHEVARACREFAQRGVEGLVWIASAFTNGNAFSTLACDPYLWRLPLLLVAEPEAEFPGQAEWTTNAWCGIVMNNFAAKHVGRAVEALAGGRANADFETGFLRFCRVVRAMAAMRGDYLLRIGDMPAGFHSAQADELLLTRTFGTRVDRADVAALLDVYKSGRASGLLGEKRFTAADVRLTARRIAEMGPVLVDRKMVEAGARLYHALRVSIEAAGATSLAVKCWPELQSKNIFPYTPCLAMGLLLADRVVWSASCESDLHTSVAQSLCTLLSGRPAACLDFVNVIDASSVIQLGHCGVGIPGCMMANDPGMPAGFVDAATRKRILSGELRLNCGVCRSSPCIHSGFVTGPNLVGQLEPGPKTGVALVPEGDGFKMLIFAGENRPDTVKGMLYSAADVEVRACKRLHQAVMDEGFSHHLAVAFGDIRPELKTAVKFYGVRVVEVD